MVVDSANTALYGQLWLPHASYLWLRTNVLEEAWMRQVLDSLQVCKTLICRLYAMSGKRSTVAQCKRHFK